MAQRKSNRQQPELSKKTWASTWWFNGLLLVACFLFLLFARLYVNQPLAGDEPIYELMDYSLVHDGDLNLKNNYVHQDYLKFMPYLNPVPQGNPAIVNLHKSKVYSFHGIGLPLLLAPGFWFGSKTGTSVEMVGLATVVIWLSWSWSYQVTKKRVASYLAAGVLTISFFFNGLAGFMYPDMIIAGLSLGILILLERYYKTLLAQAIVGVALGFLILLHYRTLDIAVPVLAVLSYKKWRDSRKLPWLAVLIVAAFTAYYYLTLHQWFGVWNTNTVYGPGVAEFGRTPQTTLSAMLFDSYRGILVYNPIFLLAFIGLPLWYKRHRESLAVMVVSIVPSIFVLALFKAWTGPYAPTGRYVMDFLPVFLPAIAFAIDRLRSWWQRAIVGLLTVATLAISLDSILTKWPLSDGSKFITQPVLFTQLKHHLGIAFNTWLPTYSNSTVLVSRHSFIKLAVCYLVVAGLAVLGWFLSRDAGLLKKRPYTKSAKSTM